jgi:predicted HTH transcriptional regulator
VRELVIETVSAFANSNSEGDLLVLGISSTGEVLGIDHLNEGQRNSIMNLHTLLRNHAAEVIFHYCQDAKGRDKTLALIYSAYVPDAICETLEAHPRAWARNGSQSVLMNQTVRDQVRFRKGILDSDSVSCCQFSPEDVDAEVVKEFRKVFFGNSTLLEITPEPAPNAACVRGPAALQPQGRRRPSAVARPGG